METVRKVVEVIDTPIQTVGGQRLIRRREKILMPNGKYRYPETIIDVSPGYRIISRKEWEDRRVPENVIKITL